LSCILTLPAEHIPHSISSTTLESGASHGFLQLPQGSLTCARRALDLPTMSSAAQSCPEAH
jgi:hypothetical protein